MASSTGDLRSQAKNVQRVRNHNHKWAKGGVPASGKRGCNHLDGWSTCHACWDKPAQMRTFRICPNHPQMTGSGRAQCKDAVALKKSARRPIEDSTALSDYKEVEERAKYLKDAELHEWTEPTTDIMYSYDFPGPKSGSDVLSSAITQAVQRFETLETEKLAREYEFVEGNDDSTADTDDEYEIVGR